MFICAMLFASAQVMNAAEESTNVKNAESTTTDGFTIDKMNVPSVDNIEECETAGYHFVSSCGGELSMNTDRDLSNKEINAIMDSLEAECSE